MKMEEGIWGRGIGPASRGDGGWRRMDGGGDVG